MAYEINPLILEKLDSLEGADEKLKGFIKDILMFEKRKMNLKEFRYKDEYESIIDRYVQSESGDK